MQPGEMWFVRLKDTTDPELVQVEVRWHEGNVVEFVSSDGRRYCDVRLLEFVGRNYQGEEKRAQEVFLASLSVAACEIPVVEDKPVVEEEPVVEEPAPKESIWKKLWS